MSVVSTSAAPLDLPQPLSGPAYSRGYRIGATFVLLLIVLQGTRVFDELQRIHAGDGGWLLWAAAIALVASYVLLLRSTTTVDAQGLRQSGLVEKKVAWSEIRHARLSGFGFARRLVVSTGYGKLRAFYAGTPELRAAFETIAGAYAEKR